MKTFGEYVTREPRPSARSRRASSQSSSSGASSRSNAAAASPIAAETTRLAARAQEAAEREPASVVPALETGLVDREMLRRGRLDDHAREQERIVALVQVRDGVHHRAPRRIAAR